MTGVQTCALPILSKILELDQIEYFTICDVTKRQWLVATLSSSSHMSSCIKQAQVTEIAMLGIGGSTTKTMPWDNFFKIILAHANSSTMVNKHQTTSGSNRMPHKHLSQHRLAVVAVLEADLAV